MEIRVLHNADCPSTAETIERLRGVLADEGVEADLSVELIEDDATAEACRFAGSPTVLVDGSDIAPPPEPAERPPGYSRWPHAVCRLYIRPDGRPSPLPPVEVVRDAIRRAGIGGKG